MMEVSKYTFVYSDKFKKHIAKYIKSDQQKILDKIKDFINELETAPTQGLGKPERMKDYGERSMWSRKINDKHRLTYEVFEEQKIIELLTCYGHYNDK